MTIFKIQVFEKRKILALGAESAGNFSVYYNKKIFLSDNFGDLLEEKNFRKFKKAILQYLKQNKIKPDIILTDLHPLYKTTIWGKRLAKKYKARHIHVQHHIAHIFSCYGEKILTDNYKLKAIKHKLFGVVCDGTGYGLDQKIWGGEIFKVECTPRAKTQFLARGQIYAPRQNAVFSAGSNVKRFERIGHLENQTMIGGDLAVREPARMLIAILDKLKITNQNTKFKKDWIFSFVKKYYNRNQFELLYNQLQQNFNCQETSSTGRILDAVSTLLGFAKNQRNYKHEPIDLLEKNSTIPYKNIKPKIINTNTNYKILTTPLFEYLIKNLHRDKKRLAATSQIYIAQCLYKILKKIQNTKYKIQNTYFAGGIAKNKIISSYLRPKGIIVNKKISCGDVGLSFGQIIYIL
jgi:hydrogenase maturation protein HypF